MYALAQQAALSRSFQHGVEPPLRSAQPFLGIGLLEEIDFLIGEIERGFDQRAQIDQTINKSLYFL